MIFDARPAARIRPCFLPPALSVRCSGRPFSVPECGTTPDHTSVLSHGCIYGCTAGQGLQRLRTVGPVCAVVQNVNSRGASIQGMDGSDAAVCVIATPVSVTVQPSAQSPSLERSAHAMTPYAQWCIRFALSFAAGTTTSHTK